MRRSRYLLLLLVPLAVGLLISPGHRAYQALILLSDIGNTNLTPSHYSGQKITKNPITLQGEKQHYDADLYIAAQPFKAAIILQHGAAEGGKDDTRLVRLAEQLARARFAVLVPEMPDTKNLMVSSGEIAILVHAVRYLQDHHIKETGLPIGIGGFSVSAGLAIHAAMLPAIRGDVSFVLAVGGYYDLPQTLSYMTTGRLYVGDHEVRITPNKYGRWLFVRSNLHRIEDASQRTVLRQIVQYRLRDDGPIPGELLSQLDETSLTILRYIENREPANSRALLHKMPATIVDEIGKLDLADKDMSSLRARLLLIHGRDDNIIPYQQSLALHRALPASRSRLYLLNNWVHVDPQDGVYDLWQMYRALYHLLQLRDNTIR